MSDQREAILERVRKALAVLPERAPLPEWDMDLSVSHRIVDGREPLELLTERVKSTNATLLTDAAELVRRLKEGGWLRGYCDPALLGQVAPFFGPEFSLKTEYDRTRVDDYDFGITRAAGAIAESGSIILNDRTTSRRLGALAPWVHIAVLARAQIYLTVGEAVLAMGDDPNVIWVTGPSKTSDIEGILIEGVHGPGVQFALVMG
ncbi:MAG: LUD domain-containing protein [Opitutales bacterium]